MSEPTPSKAALALQAHRTAQAAAARAAVADGPDAPWVRAAATPFMRRRWWLFAFLGLMGLDILQHLLRLSPLILFDVVVVIAGLSLFQGILGFQRAAQSGDPEDLEKGVRGLMRAIAINAVAGWVVLLLAILGFVLMFAMAGTFLTALSQGMGHP